MATESPQIDLIQRAVSGNRPALEELLLIFYDRLARRIGRRLPRNLRRVFSEEDILQQTYAEVFQRIGSFQPKGRCAFYRWLVTIADHRLQDAARAQQTVKRGGQYAVALAAGQWTEDSIDRLIESVAGSEHTPSQSVARREAVAAVQMGLASLEEEYRKPLELRFVHGMTIPQVATTLGKKPRAIRDLCRRALQELRAVLGRSSQFLSRR